MRIRRPSHTTVVAYMALFAALGGTAIAARDDIGAKELKAPIVRQKTVPIGAGNAVGTAIVKCRPKEQFLSGGGGWDGLGNVGPQPSVGRALFFQKQKNKPPKGIVIGGTKPVEQANTLIAQAVCLPK